MTRDNLVLLHGALGGSEQFRPLAQALEPDLAVHLLDFEGHAQAASRDRPFRVEHFVENVRELIESKRIAKAHIFGYSMGGYVALCLALAHPERVGSIVTLGTKYRWDPATAAREAARLDPAVIRAKVPRFADALQARHARAGGWELVLDRTADFLRNLGDQPVLTEESLSQIPHSVRVLVGDRDNTVSVDEGASVAKLLPGGSTTVLADTPHPIEQVSIELLATELRNFLGAVS